MATPDGSFLKNKMKLNVTLKNDAVPQALRDYAERKVTDLEHFGQDFEKSEVILDVERHETICEIVLYPRRGQSFVATERATDGRSAVAVCRRRRRTPRGCCATELRH